MKLWAVSDLHLSHRRNREAFDAFPSFPDDWLILAGDIVDGHHLFDWCLDSLNGKFRQLVWVPGNHELWTRPGDADEPRGVALYERLVGIARDHGVITPEDRYPEFPHPSGTVLIAPLFLLYDYSFRPDHVGADQVVPWAAGADSVCTDEYLLHPDPFPGRGKLVRGSLRPGRGEARGLPAGCRQDPGQPFPPGGGTCRPPEGAPLHPLVRGRGSRADGTGASTHAPSSTDISHTRRTYWTRRHPLPGDFARLSRSVGPGEGHRRVSAGGDRGAFESLAMTAGGEAWAASVQGR